MCNSQFPDFLFLQFRRFREKPFTLLNFGDFLSAVRRPRDSKSMVLSFLIHMVLIVATEPASSKVPSASPQQQEPYPSELLDMQRENIEKARGAYHMNVGLQLYIKGKYKAAHLAFTNAIELHPKLPGVFYHRGNANFRLNMFKEAIDDYDQAIRLEPDFVLAFANRGNALSVLGRLEEALDSFQAAASIEPLNTYVLFNRGYVFGKKGDHRAAISDFSKVFELDPNDVDALILRAAAYLHVGDVTKADRDYSRAVILDPYNPRLR